MLKKVAGQPGVFVSNWLLLISFKVDKIAAGDSGLLAHLGDTVTATYGEKEATATVPVKKVVSLHINILNDKKGGKPVISPLKVLSDLLNASAIYAQAGIQIKVASIQIVNPPPKVDLSKGLVSHFVFGANWDSRGAIPMTPAERNLLGAADLRSKAQNDIEVYYVNFLAKNDGTPFTDGLGESFPASLVPAQFAGSIIISADFEEYQTLAHEIGHILLNNGKHDGRIVNLMAGGTPQVGGTVTDSRRITADEVTLMLKSKLALNPPKQ